MTKYQHWSKQLQIFWKFLELLFKLNAMLLQITKKGNNSFKAKMKICIVYTWWKTVFTLGLHFRWIAHFLQSSIDSLTIPQKCSSFSDSSSPCEPSTWISLHNQRGELVIQLWGSLLKSRGLALETRFYGYFIYFSKAK